MRCSPANIKSKDMAQKLMKGNKEAGEGLYKLYKSKPEVVQKMGYTMQMGKEKSGMDSSHTFPMKQAYTIRMSPMLQTTDEEGQPQNITSEKAIGQTGALGTLETTTNTEVIPGGQETKKRLSYQEAWDQNIIEPGQTMGLRDRFEAKGLTFEDYVGGRQQQQKADPTAYELDLVTKTGVSGGPGVITIDKPDETVTTTTEKFTPEISHVQGLSPVGQRRDIRRGRILSRNIGKLERKLRKAKKGSNKAKAIQRELDVLNKQSELRTQQQMQGKTGTQTYDIDKMPTTAQAAELKKAGSSSGTSATPTIDIAGITGSGKKSNEFGRFGYQAGSMLENIAMPMMKFKGKKSGYKK
jgi:hypothetical protein